MSIKNWSHDIVVLDLPEEPELLYELEGLAMILREQNNCKVLIDFSEVGQLTAAAISKLLEVRQLADYWGHRFALCNVSEAIAAMFKEDGHTRALEVFDDRELALMSLDMVG